MRTQTKMIKLVIISCSFTIILLVSSEEAMVASKEFITSVVVGKYVKNINTISFVWLP